MMGNLQIEGKKYNKGKVKILGKVKSYKGSLPVYRELTKKDPKVFQIKRELYWKIIAEFHELLSQKMIDKGHDYRCPKGIGTIFIRKHKPNFSDKKKVDWKVYNKTKVIEPLGIDFYEKDHARWIWKRNPRRVKGVTNYVFRANFTNRREVSKEVLYNGKDKVYSKNKEPLV